MQRQSWRPIPNARPWEKRANDLLITLKTYGMRHKESVKNAIKISIGVMNFLMAIAAWPVKNFEARSFAN